MKMMSYAAANTDKTLIKTLEVLFLLFTEKQTQTLTESRYHTAFA